MECLLKYETKRYQSIWDSLSKYNCAIIQNYFDLPIDRSLGNLDCYDMHGKTNFINEMNQYFSRSAR
jgi:hypothetical protein